MEDRVKIEYVEIERGRRLLVTSDIHGHAASLKKVLEKAEFSDDDILVIIGDIVEKGPESLKTLRYVMELCERGNVLPLIGNVDAWRLHMINGIRAESVQGFYDYLLHLRAWIGTSFFDELTRELGYICTSPADILKSKDRVLGHFRRELDFLSHLPAIVETQDYVFVHGGLRDREVRDNGKRPLFELLKYDRFMDTELCFDKYVVVGHWPVSNYGGKYPQANPLIDREKRIISIDGGCGLKANGQLNLLIFPEAGCDLDDVYVVSHDDLPVYLALTPQVESADSIHICWPDNEIRILEKGDEFSRVLHIATGRSVWMPNAYLLEDTHCRDYTDSLLPVCPGDRVSLEWTTSKGAIVKKDGRTGWYCGELEKSGEYREYSRAGLVPVSRSW